MDIYPSSIRAARGGNRSVVRILLVEGVQIGDAPIYTDVEMRMRMSTIIDWRLC